MSNVVKREPAMKKFRNALLIGLVLLLSSCHERFEHVADAHNGISGMAMFGYVVFMIFFLGFLLGGIPLIVFGVRRLKRRPDTNKATPIVRISIGSVMATVGLVSMIVFSCTFFNKELTIPEARDYRTVEKVLKEANDSKNCFFRVSTRNYLRNYYAKDDGLYLKSALSDMTFKSSFQRGSDSAHGQCVHYYVELNGNSNYPYSEICVYEDGYSYVDYVKDYNRRTVTYYYTTDSNDAKNLISLAEERNDYAHKQAEAIDKEAYEAGKIENFFASAMNNDSVASLIYIDGRAYDFSFKKEAYDIIADLRYTQVSEEDVSYSATLFTTSTNGERWGFALRQNNPSGYYVEITYTYENYYQNFDSFKYYYLIRDVDGKQIYDIAFNQFKDQRPDLFDTAKMEAYGKIENFFKQTSNMSGEFSAHISYGAYNRDFAFKQEGFAAFKDFTYTQVEESAITNHFQLVTININNPRWEFQLIAKSSSEHTNCAIKLVYEYREITGETHEVIYYYDISDEDGQAIYDVAFNQFKEEYPTTYYAGYPEGYIEKFLAKAIENDHEGSVVTYLKKTYTINMKKEYFASMRNFEYTLVTDKKFTSEEHLLKVTNASPYWEFNLHSDDSFVNDYFIHLKYKYLEKNNEEVTLEYYYTLKADEAITIYNFALNQLAFEQPEVFS